ncbi:HAD hydrolase-like protein [bacterium]|nr:HAD hydrolase-like protein [bacterium]
MVEIPARFKDIELIILDMDGVITSEQTYWDVAGLVVRELVESPAFLGLSPPNYTPVASLFYQKLARGTRLDWRKYLAPELIKKCKLRGINSNWDLTYVAAGLYLAPLFAPLIAYFHKRSQETSSPPKTNAFSNHFHSTDEELMLNGEDHASGKASRLSLDELQHSLSPIWESLCNIAQNKEWNAFLRAQQFYLWGDYFRKQNHAITPLKNIELLIIDDFHPNVTGLRLLDELNHIIQQSSGSRLPVFGRNTKLWEECRDLFQGWYLGEDLYEQIHKKPLSYTPKPGLIYKEDPLLGRDNTHACLTELKNAGFRLGVATGRPRMEIMKPLEQWDMLQYFEADRIVTYDEVEKAEADLRAQGVEKNIVKPHPYTFLKAIRPELSCVDIVANADTPLPERNKVLIVGDAQADIWAAQTIGCHCAAVLSGAIGPSSKKLIEATHPDVICQNVLELSHALCLGR